MAIFYFEEQIQLVYKLDEDAKMYVNYHESLKILNCTLFYH